MHASKTDDTESLIRCAKIVASWALALALLPPNGLLWQLGVLTTCSNWLVHSLLAAMNMTGLVQ